ncbi:platelet endothelial aggregation receptor 1-like [Ostrea edulis]|uniref:platelet endothelial aggregation receptor 1-like n=1 Tax=Ostrea edulis TaxID=37623 RepID=UPI0024AF2A25|nr:platelet endothelial aggregation receptor 1-like [Ostrea edulis]
MNVQILFLTVSVGYIRGCPHGYFGQNCELGCRHPSYGKNCQSLCICPPEICNHSTGCPDGTVTKEFNYQQSTFPTINNTTETSVQSDAASMWKTLNEKEIGMVISITTLGLLFLVLTALHIWVSHRISVETNNHEKATIDLDEISIA